MTGKQPIQLDSLVARGESLMSSDLDGETVMMSIESGKYYGLDDIGSRIWALVEQPLSVGNLCDTLMTEFEVDRETCQQHVLEFLEELRDESIVTIVEETPA